nr:MAG TPA: hypothetical protein [Caudoviricetes sp.]
MEGANIRSPPSESSTTMKWVRGILHPSANVQPVPV